MAAGVDANRREFPVERTLIQRMLATPAHTLITL